MKLIFSTFVFSVAFVIFSSSCSAQQATDSVYTKRFEHYYSIYPVIKFRQEDFSLLSKVSDKASTFIPNTNFFFGVGAYIFGVDFELVKSITTSNASSYGKSISRDWSFSLSGSHFGLSVFANHYLGFYRDNSTPTSTAATDVVIRPDVLSQNTGVDGTYSFSRKYSYAAPFSFSEQQLKSHGSLMLTGSFNIFRVSADSALASREVIADVGSQYAFNTFRYTSISIAPGYGHTVVWKNFFIHGSIFTGPGNVWIMYKTNGTRHDNVNINLYSCLKLSLGYNRKNFYTGFYFIQKTRQVRFDNMQVDHNALVFRIELGFRFPEKGILKKHAPDYIKDFLMKEF